MEDARKALLAQREKLVLSPKSALSSGSTLLNLACTDHPHCGFMKGAYYYLVGDSTSGKTWLSLSCFAESVLNKSFRGYDLIFDDVEGGALMDIERYFGKEVAKRMRAPGYREGEPVYSDTIESFYYNMRRLLKSGRSFIYVLDSQDALDSMASVKKFDKQQKASEEGQEAKGSYGDGKAKYHSANIRWVLSGLKRTKSILIIIGQARDNPAAMGYADKKTRSGGRALRFYANLEIWTSVGKKIKKTVHGRPRTIGVRCIAEVKKNRVTGKTGRDRSVEIPIYYGFGIDDIGSCIDFLVGYKHWKKNREGAYDAKELEFQGTRGEIIRYVEQSGLEEKLRQLTGEVWAAIEEECQIKDRKRRYE